MYVHTYVYYVHVQSHRGVMGYCSFEFHVNCTRINGFEMAKDIRHCISFHGNYATGNPQ